QSRTTAIYTLSLHDALPILQNGAQRVSGKPKEHQGKVLFINADREYFEGRAQNFLLPEHIEKIVTTFGEFKEVPGFSAIVEIAADRKSTRLNSSHVKISYAV